ncbi:hypothetical protein [Microbulbifer sp. 2205BS26-8]|uniref:hypothetical protein n=1 Tax=Microbulbifer sp. 2205BS26-8 TaxID=3064386 RepID=UPI00273D3AA2|nr:hypothetical protein [Microbulbifer sp. 2205BS26-8]MDP5208251.1 hypothetical protein [Microbulbifer sp. 2205BS26-8]
MSTIREMKISLLDWEARIVLESLTKELQRLKNINETSEDEDEAAEAGNDYLEVASLKERLESEAVTIYGEQIKNFSQEEI